MASSPPRVRPHDPTPFGDPNLATRVRPEPLLWRLLALLELRPDDLLIQLGCAYPDYLVALTELVPLRYQALVVDSSPQRLAPFVGTPKLRSLAMDPLRFAAYPMQCDRILVEDALLRDELARELFARLRPAGRLLAVGAVPRPGSPPGEEERARAARPGADRVARALEGAGFEVRCDAAQLGSRRIDLFLGVKAASS